MAFGYVSNLLKLRVMNMQNLRCFDICKLFNHVHSSSEVELINVIFLLTMQFANHFTSTALFPDPQAFPGCVCCMPKVESSDRIL